MRINCQALRDVLNLSIRSHAPALERIIGVNYLYNILLIERSGNFEIIYSE